MKQWSNGFESFRNMRKRQLDRVSVTSDGTKLTSFLTEDNDQPAKRTKVLLEEDDIAGEEDGSSNEAGGVPVDSGKPLVDGQGFTINQEYARRFEHNKKREELHKCA